jgi:hypothetical protein
MSVVIWNISSPITGAVCPGSIVGEWFTQLQFKLSLASGDPGSWCMQWTWIVIAEFISPVCNIRFPHHCAA